MATLAAIGIVGYHPYSEDAGIYVAGIKQFAHPGLYGSSAAFITPYFQWSLFPNFNVWLLRTLRLPLSYQLFFLQILTTWLLLYALWELATLCLRQLEERWAAVLLTLICLPVPIAGSSLFLMDPYLTGRSFSTPLALLSLSACLQGKALRTISLLLLVALFHPLMAIYAAGFVLLLWAIKCRLWPSVAVLIAGSIATGALVQYSQRQIVESPAYLAAVVTRYYYFLYRWRWYELVGVLAPLVLLTVYCRSTRLQRSANSIVLARTCLTAGLTSITISLLFARPGSRSHLISALQTIRPFIWIYFLMFLLLGGLLARFWLHRSALRWTVFFLIAGAGMTFEQHQAYPSSAQVELPWIQNHNGWNRAFLWIKDQTPANALFALDADYIHIPGEDGQGFRAITERASLADLSKDGGAAAAFPQLSERWWAEQTATANLNQIDDAERLRRLAPFHVDWLVLTASASTSFPCPFIDDAVKVCRLPQPE